MSSNQTLSVLQPSHSSCEQWMASRLSGDPLGDNNKGLPEPFTDLSLSAQNWALALSLCLSVYLLVRFLNFSIQHTQSWISRLLLTSVQVNGGIVTGCSNEHRTYERLLKFLAKHCESQIHTSRIILDTIYSTPPEDSESDCEDEQMRPSPDYEWVVRVNKGVGYGTSYLRYNGTRIRVDRQVIDPPASAEYVSQEMVTVTTFFWNKAVLAGILEKVKPKPMKKDNSKIVIYKADPEGNYWNRLGNPKKKRPLSTLVLDERVVEKVVDDVHKFMGMSEWYEERGIPFRRGYLLYGPPGCGKSSIVKAIAGELNYDICVFSLSQKLTDNGLTELFNNAPAKSIILLEDIDAAFKSREDGGASARETNLAFEGCSSSGLTFMGLLNALDGVASADDGQLVFMTTNFPEKLDPALIRPGRVDLKICIDYPSDTQVVGIFRKFYPELTVDSDLPEAFLKKVRALKGVKPSMAMLQGIMIVYQNEPEEAINNFEEHFKEQFDNTRLAKDKLAQQIYC